MKRKYYKLVIFDLDGTLVDTSPGIIDSYNYTAEKMKYDKFTDSELRGFIGYKLLNVFAEEFNMPQKKAFEATKIYRQKYAESGINNVNVYQKMPQLLEQLSKEGYILAIATLKLDVFAKQMMKNLNISQYFTIIKGVQENVNQDKADLIKEVLLELKIKPEETVLIGDSKFDLIGAEKANIDFIAVTYGFGFKSEEKIKSDKMVMKTNNIEQLLAFFR